MREILFRGKRIDNGEWITGGIFQQKADDVKDEVVYIIDNSSNDVDWAHRVIADTVGQYTGLTDRNGRKIFEGDIVNILTENEEFGIITYDDGGFFVDASTFSVDFMNNINGSDIEVIDNIHDNPELLEVVE